MAAVPIFLMFFDDN